ncbi:hypothetical protein ABT093_35955 [Kitasatospora sp. NPDC002551]|uniref:hypothetical protein n=1 Tax=Kitasatospora sp. NPDC002551 TaxID=3154539 RepID=UPI003330BA70
MRTRTTAVALAAAALLAAGLTACSSSATTTDTKAPATSAAAQPSAPPAAAASEAATTTQVPAATGTAAAPAATAPAGIPPKPDAATQAKYIAALTAIDPEIVGDKPDRAVSRGRDQCRSVAQYPSDQTKLVELAGQRFTSAQHPQGFGPEKSAKILAAVRAHICPTY